MQNLYKKLAKLAFFALAIMFILGLTAFAQDILPLDGTEYVGIPKPPDGSGQKIAIDLMLSALGYVKVLAVVIGTMFLVIQGVRLVLSSGDEDALSKVKSAVIYILVAFVLISMSEDLAKIFDMSKGTLIGTPSDILKRVHIFDKQVEVFMTFIKYILGSVATLILVMAGLKMVTSGSDEEETSKQKKKVLYSLSGLLMLFIGDIAINKVFYNVNKEVYSGITGVRPTINASEGVSQIIGVTNIIVTLFGTLAVFTLIVAAIFYASSMGNEEQMEKAKRIIFATIIAMVIMFGAFAVVSTIVSGQLNVT